MIQSHSPEVPKENRQETLRENNPAALPEHKKLRAPPPDAAKKLSTLKKTVPSTTVPSALKNSALAKLPPAELPKVKILANRSTEKKEADLRILARLKQMKEQFNRGSQSGQA